jgi:hypothetical protein
MVPSSFMISQITPRGRGRRAGEVDRALGLAGALQHAAVARAQREDVARGDDVRGPLRRGDRGRHGARAVGGGDAGGDALARLDRDGEGGVVGRLVVLAIIGSCSRSTCRAVSDRQISPRAWVAMKLMASGVTSAAAITRSPSFSRSSSSTRMNMRPARRSSSAISTRRRGSGCMTSNHVRSPVRARLHPDHRRRQPPLRRVRRAVHERAPRPLQHGRVVGDAQRGVEHHRHRRPVDAGQPHRQPRIVRQHRADAHEDRVAARPQAVTILARRLRRDPARLPRRRRDAAVEAQVATFA